MRNIDVREQENAFTLNGATITEKSIKLLQKYQQDGNQYLLEQECLISDTIVLIAKQLNDHPPLDGETAEVMRIITDLAFLRDQLKNLEKP